MIRIDQVPRASELLYMADGGALLRVSTFSSTWAGPAVNRSGKTTVPYRSGIYGGNNAAPPVESRIFFPHQNASANAVFVDGHTDSFTDALEHDTLDQWNR